MIRPEGPLPELFTETEATVIGIIREVCFHGPENGPANDWPALVIAFMRENGIAPVKIEDLQTIRIRNMNMIPPDRRPRLPAHD